MNRDYKGWRAQGRESARAVVACALVACAFVAGAKIPRAYAGEGGGVEAIDIVIEALRGDDEAMQTVAIAMARDIAGAEATQALAKELPNLSGKAQVQLLSALADRGDKAALPAVAEAAKAGDESVRVAALKAVGELGDASSVTMLAETAGRTRGAEQKAARESLYRLRGPEIDQMILASIAGSQPVVKVELVSSIAERNITAGAETVLKTAKDADREVRVESLRVLRVMAGEKHLPELVDLLVGAQSESERREAEKTVVAVAGRIAELDQRAKVVLAALASAKDLKVRCSLLSVLGRIGDSNALGVLREALTDSNAEVQTTTIRALSGWPTASTAAEPMAELLKVAQTSDNKIHQILALRGFIGLIGIAELAAKDKMDRYKQAMGLATGVTERRMVLSGLSAIPSYAAMQMVADSMKDNTLRQEAEVAVVRIAAGIYDSHTQGTKDALKPQIKALLEQVIQTSQNESVRQQAQQVIDRFEGKAGGSEVEAQGP